MNGIREKLESLAYAALMGLVGLAFVGFLFGVWVCDRVRFEVPW